ncbi:polymorphic toxin-type HINT domain-containing protein [Nocardiopsis suaedae]|uniref:Polymorphic toxin-type HINT domain-containing protein n=1 Tax=Nocardiopsis suaedae TaxID=3018444 RepID=A0ABT4TWA0_9ACTN|nr:polymorphic toxin-type HINT domain-containing protein [Nocardiopsis suaedae]MDA2808963.1 polymorphic toxin-type HINT domain-containing protein [Nocardiopsis suaedae]
MLTRIHDPERGASYVEYAAVTVLIGAIIAVLLNAAFTERMAETIQENIAAAITGEPTGGDGPSSGDGPGADGEDNGMPGGDSGSGGEPFVPADWQFSAGPPEDAMVSPLGLGNPGGITTGFHPGGYRVEEVGFGEWASETADQAQGFGEELKSIGEDTVEDAKQSFLHPIETAKQTAEQTQEWALDEWDQLKSSAAESRERFDETWKNEGPLAAAWGLYWDNARYLNMESPVGIGDLFFPDAVRDPWNEGEYGRSAAQFAVNAVTYAPYLWPAKILRWMPDADGGGRNGGGGGAKDSEDAPKDEKNEDQDEDGITCASNSFVPGTGVLMADGSTAPIESIGVGDEVWAFDPLTGEEGPRPVTATIVGEGEKTLVDITVTNEEGTVATVTATDGHPFWVPDRAEWVDAADLSSGTWLRTSAGTWQQVSAVDVRAATDEEVHNLTVEGLQTYYAEAGSDAVLVHNQGNDPCGADKWTSVLSR